MACMEDDAIGVPLTVFREREVDWVVLGESNWEAVAQRGFDRPKPFVVYLDTLRWNYVTATDAHRLQVPCQAGAGDAVAAVDQARRDQLPAFNVVVVAGGDGKPLRLGVHGDGPGPWGQSGPGVRLRRQPLEHPQPLSGFPCAPAPLGIRCAGQQHIALCPCFKADVEPRRSVSLFEHRVFLSATPHNGHGNRFTA